MSTIVIFLCLYLHFNPWRTGVDLRDIFAFLSAFV